ncbi:translation initiation factor IF-2 [Bubalus bubalis]|uniref:translation initiation factor IF-2 n=1 Tax=Bubalus bubalis TaxID=89462 RepID=UPI000DBC94D3|nr:translation initiation factor IF-2 [Bubalus bubalis]
MSARGRRPPPHRGDQAGAAGPRRLQGAAARAGTHRAHRPRGEGTRAAGARRAVLTPCGAGDRASGRPGGEGAAPGGALRRRVPEPLMGRARPQPRSRGTGRRKRPCRMEIDLARRRLSRRCGSPVVWLLAPDALSWCRCCSHRASVKSEFLAKGPCILIGEVMKSKALCCWAGRAVQK